MSQDTDQQSKGDGMADSMAAVAVITIIILTLYIWLSGMPS
jgi:hypothetical protein